MSLVIRYVPVQTLIVKYYTCSFVEISDGVKNEETDFSGSSSTEVG